eukprot:GHVU01092867.1.p2 GENE.GHVU01092867.1~~GHVU01092867.1.p2  ORF type:complete len:178 (-),score=17.58 GHVU01092867.1:814-1347(-)
MDRTSTGLSRRGFRRSLPVGGNSELIGTDSYNLRKLLSGLVCLLPPRWPPVLPSLVLLVLPFLVRLVLPLVLFLLYPLLLVSSFLSSSFSFASSFNSTFIIFAPMASQEHVFAKGQSDTEYRPWRVTDLLRTNEWSIKTADRIFKVAERQRQQSGGDVLAKAILTYNCKHEFVSDVA